MCILVTMCWSWSGFKEKLEHRISFGLFSKLPPAQHLRKPAYSLVCVFPAYTCQVIDFSFSLYECGTRKHTTKSITRTNISRVKPTQGERTAPLTLATLTLLLLLLLLLLLAAGKTLL